MGLVSQLAPHQPAEQVTGRRVRLYLNYSIINRMVAFCVVKFSYSSLNLPAYYNYLEYIRDCLEYLPAV